MVGPVRVYRAEGDVRLLNLGDVHRGDVTHDNEAFQRVLAFIEDSRDVVWVSTGDLLNVALASSPSDVYRSLSLQEEFDALVKELTPIASRCLGVVASNHHNRFDRAVGMSLDRLLCRELGVPYLGKTGVINVVAGRSSYMIAVAHGYGGGRTRGGKTNNLARFAQIYPGADVYLKGHTHTYEFFIGESFVLDRKRAAVRLARSYYVTTGHFLSWRDSYAEQREYEPAPCGAALLTLCARGVGKFSEKRVLCDLIS